MNDFVEWILEEMYKRDWTQADLVRASKGMLTTAHVSRVLGRKQNAGLQFCKGIARAFDVTPDEVMRHAGILPNIDKDTRHRREIEYLLDNVPEDAIDDVLEFIRYKIGRKKKGSSHAKSSQAS